MSCPVPNENPADLARRYQPATEELVVLGSIKPFAFTGLMQARSNNWIAARQDTQQWIAKAS